jgi:hypothetical protein
MGFSDWFTPAGAKIPLGFSVYEVFACSMTASLVFFKASKDVSETSL